MDKYRQISRVLWIILAANLVVAATKIILGYYFKMNSLVADGYHAITDSTSNIIGLIGIKLASKPANRNYPYGHKKFETLTSLSIGFLLFILTIQMITQAIRWFFVPQTPTINLVSFITLGITVLINTVVAFYEHKKGRELGSEVLISDSLHTKSDVFITLGVLVTMISIYFGAPAIIDPILSLIIAVFVIRASFSILKTAMQILADKQLVDPDLIRDLVLKFHPAIIDVHQVRSRGRQDEIYIDLHLILDGTTQIAFAHDLSHEIEDYLEQELDKKVQLIIHLEPEIQHHEQHDQEKHE